LGETVLEIRYPLGARKLPDHTPRVSEVPIQAIEMEQCASAVV
jgi:hypothetical protein